MDNDLPFLPGRKTNVTKPHDSGSAGFHGSRRDSDRILPANAAKVEANYDYDTLPEIQGEHRGNWAFYVPQDRKFIPGVGRATEENNEATAWDWARAGGVAAGRSRVYRTEAEGEHLTRDDDVGVLPGEHVARSLKVTDTEWTPTPHAYTGGAEGGPRGNWHAQYNPGTKKHEVQGTLPPLNWAQMRPDHLDRNDLRSDREEERERAMGNIPGAAPHGHDEGTTFETAGKPLMKVRPTSGTQDTLPGMDGPELDPGLRAVHEGYQRMLGNRSS